MKILILSEKILIHYKITKTCQDHISDDSSILVNEEKNKRDLYFFKDNRIIHRTIYFPWRNKNLTNWRWYTNAQPTIFIKKK